MAGMAMAAAGQTVEETEKGEKDHSISNPGPKNEPILKENPSTQMPPPTDHGDVGVIWYSFDLARKRAQEGGWTHQVTEREIPNSKDLAGVNMRLTPGSFREAHWHLANEWAMMLYGKARVTVFMPDGKMFIDDIEAGDLWFFPSGYPHSIQGLGPDGCQFLLVFDQGNFSEDDTFLPSDWIAHTPPDVLAKNMNLPMNAVKQLPKKELYIFPSPNPRSLEEDKRAIGLDRLETARKFTFHVGDMKPTIQTAGGSVHIFDTSNFFESKTVAAALVRIKPGGIREMHWHPTGSEWDFYIQGTGRETVFNTGGKARTMEFNANDVGFIPSMAGHYIENVGKEDLVFLEMFRSPVYEDYSLNNWLRSLPPELAAAHLQLSEAELASIPKEKAVVLPL